jgi:hypothetical protein
LGYRKLCERRRDGVRREARCPEKLVPLYIRGKMPFSGLIKQNNQFSRLYV